MMSEYQKRELRGLMLKTACGVLKNKHSQYNKIIGIAMYAPKYNEKNSNDFYFLDCKDWTEEDVKIFKKHNEIFRLFETNKIGIYGEDVNEFPE